MIFAHIPKTAGSSVMDALKHHGVWSCGHNPLSYVANKWKEQWAERDHSFTIMRNPWDRMVSFYLMSGWPSLQYLKNRPFPPEGQERKDRFQQWVLKGVGDELGRVKSAQKMLTTKTGEVLVDRVYEFADVQQVINSYLRAAGQPEREVHVNQRTFLDRGHYSTYYTDYVREKVAVWGAMEIERMGYTFDGR